MVGWDGCDMCDGGNGLSSAPWSREGVYYKHQINKEDSRVCEESYLASPKVQRHKCENSNGWIDVAGEGRDGHSRGGNRFRMALVIAGVRKL